MDNETLVVLKASIEKWKINVEAKTPMDTKLGPNDCALCGIFFGLQKSNCHGCPVREQTGRAGCSESPYEEAVEARGDWREDFLDLHGEDPDEWEVSAEAMSHLAWIVAAQAEVDFLKSLLPVEANAEGEK